MRKIDLYIVQKVINLLDKYKNYRNRPLTQRMQWNDLIKNKDKVIYRLKNNLNIILHADSMLSKLIYDDFESMEEGFIGNFLKAGDIFFDVGANIGFHTINAGGVLKENGFIYAFEPARQTFNRLLENIELNGLGGTVKPFQAGLSNTNTVLELNVSESDMDAYNSFAHLEYVTLNGKQKVEVYTAAHIIKQENIDLKKVALIKIDVEGWEINVLKGMEELFANEEFQPCFLVEFTEENMFRAGYSCRELYAYLKDKGYNWYTYDAQLNEITASKLKAYYPYENLIASKNEKALINRLLPVS